MEERYGRLFTLPVNLYCENSPTIISAGALLKDNVKGRVLVHLKIRSISPKTIKAVKVKVYPLDTVNKPLGEDVVFEYLLISVLNETKNLGSKLLFICRMLQPEPIQLK